MLLDKKNKPVYTDILVTKTLWSMIIIQFIDGKTKVLSGSYSPTANKWLFKKTMHSNQSNVAAETVFLTIAQHCLSTIT